MCHRVAGKPFFLDIKGLSWRNRREQLPSTSCCKLAGGRDGAFVTGSYSGGTWDSCSTVLPLSGRSSPLPLLFSSMGLVMIPVATVGLNR